MLKKFFLISLFMLFSFNALAKDNIAQYSIDDALSLEAAKTKLSGDVKFYFGNSKTPKIKKTVLKVTTNKKTNGFGKSDLKACQWVFLSAMIQLQESAIKNGANAVINIQSFYKKKPYSSSESFECANGALMAGVALQGTLVKM